MKFKYSWLIICLLFSTFASRIYAIQQPHFNSASLTNHANSGNTWHDFTVHNKTSGKITLVFSWWSYAGGMTNPVDIPQGDSYTLSWRDGGQKGYPQYVIMRVLGSAIPASNPSGDFPSFGMSYYYSSNNSWYNTMFYAKELATGGFTDGDKPNWIKAYAPGGHYEVCPRGNALISYTTMLNLGSSGGVDGNNCYISTGWNVNISNPPQPHSFTIHNDADSPYTLSVNPIAYYVQHCAILDSPSNPSSAQLKPGDSVTIKWHEDTSDECNSEQYKYQGAYISGPSGSGIGEYIGQYTNNEQDNNQQKGLFYASQITAAFAGTDGYKPDWITPSCSDLGGTNCMVGFTKISSSQQATSSSEDNWGFNAKINNPQNLEPVNILFINEHKADTGVIAGTQIDNVDSPVTIKGTKANGTTLSYTVDNGSSVTISDTSTNWSIESLVLSHGRHSISITQSLQAQTSTPVILQLDVVVPVDVTIPVTSGSVLSHDRYIIKCVGQPGATVLLSISDGWYPIATTTVDNSGNCIPVKGPSSGPGTYTLTAQELMVDANVKAIKDASNPLEEINTDEHEVRVLSDGSDDE